MAKTCTAQKSWYTQYIETFLGESAARASLMWLAEQSDYRGGRVIAPSPEKPGWRVQTFHEDCGAMCAGLLPDGAQRVLVLDSQRTLLGIRADHECSGPAR